jgi:4-amino-4-deoxy-L-arabinose transferase-like glycosyltransferase
MSLAELRLTRPREQGFVRADAWPRLARLGLLAVLALAVVLRFWGLRHDLPFSYFGDELHFMKLSMGMGTGDLNPHWFHKPAFLMYVLALVYGLFFGWGRAFGSFDSTAAFGARFLTDPGPFLLLGRLVIFACGVATVYVVYLLARRAFRSVEAGLAAALTAAVLASMVASSQDIKSDIPCALLMALSVYLYLGVRETASRRPLVLAALVAGAAMGTHYYALVLVPTYLVLETLRAFESRTAADRRMPWRELAVRAGLVVLLFLGGFFITSPYNFLDPTWMRGNVERVGKTFGLGSTKAQPVERYEADSGTEFKPGAASTGGAAVAFLKVLLSRNCLGVTFAVLALLGAGLLLVRRETRWYGLLVLIPTAIFFFFAVTTEAYHAQPRHLNAIFPLLATLVWPGAEFLAGLFPGSRRSGSTRPILALGLVALAALPSAVRAASHDAEISRLDSRLVAYRWLVANVPHDARLLVDDYGPILQPDSAALRRQQALLATLPSAPFTQHQALRLELLQRYPAPEGMNLDELGHPWWLPREKSDAALRSTASDLDMGSPLVSRVPQTLAAYRAQGIRYVVTNGEARGLYFDEGKNAAGGFPSFVRFYRELEALPPVKTFDPATWGGKGPVIWVYDLR